MSFPSHFYPVPTMQNSSMVISYHISKLWAKYLSLVRNWIKEIMKAEKPPSGLESCWLFVLPSAFWKFLFSCATLLKLSESTRGETSVCRRKDDCHRAYYSSQWYWWTYMNKRALLKASRVFVQLSGFVFHKCCCSAAGKQQSLGQNL